MKHLGVKSSRTVGIIEEDFRLCRGISYLIGWTYGVCVKESG